MEPQDTSKGINSRKCVVNPVLKVWVARFTNSIKKSSRSGGTRRTDLTFKFKLEAFEVQLFEIDKKESP